MNFIELKGSRLATGFTLVEVLIGLVLFSLILTALTSSFYGASRAWTASNRGDQNNETKRMGDGFLRRTLQQTVPLTVIDGSKRQLLFTGSSDHLTFAAPLPAHTGSAGLYVLNLKIGETTDGKSGLMLTYDALAGRNNIPDVDNPSGKTLILLPGIAAVHFMYFGAAKVNAPPEWTDTWRDQDVLPEYVRVDLTAAEPLSAWPSLIVPLRVRVARGEPEFVLYTADTR